MPPKKSCEERFPGNPRAIATCKKIEKMKGQGEAEKAKKKPDDKKDDKSKPQVLRRRYTNPDFELWKRKRSFAGDKANDRGEILRRGRLWRREWDGKVPKADEAQMFQFLYNPSEITVSYNSQIKPEALKEVLTAQYKKPESGTPPNLVGMVPVPSEPNTGNISLQLLCDRTYETWLKPGKGKGTLAQEMGVLVDVQVFHEMLGMSNFDMNAEFFNFAGSPQYQGPYIRNTLTVPPSPTTVMLELGPLRYYGYILNFSVSYTHFTAYLVPNRCVISTNITLLPPPNYRLQEQQQSTDGGSGDDAGGRAGRAGGN
ncbi:hypothetical protein [Actinomadura atramentaria]|uniref:hypothetical protein n=1 Tax=Actinomadura atramentaria TaxID=1990 RepID=UPI000380949F|nr:hypothetical protein [Actinomadura atramentaria]